MITMEDIQFCIMNKTGRFLSNYTILSGGFKKKFAQGAILYLQTMI